MPYVVVVNRGGGGGGGGDIRRFYFTILFLCLAHGPFDNTIIFIFTKFPDLQ